jgi:ribosomal protein S12 methylthiotransferase accessory factor
MELLYKIYQVDLVDEILEDLKDPKEALQYYNLPTCFECEVCPIKEGCKFFDVIEIVKKVQTNMQKNIDQTNLRKLIYENN